MKKVLLSALSLAMAAVSVVASPTQPIAMWGKLFDGTEATHPYTGNASAGDIGENVVLGKDGNLYWHLIGGSYDGAKDIMFGGTKLFEGSGYDPSGTSQNNNLCVLKTDQNGNVLWNLHSTSCDYSTNEGCVAPTTDGGVFFSAKMRCTDFGTDCQWEDVTLVDGKGKEWKYKWNHTATDTRRYQKILVGRLDAEGNLLWVKFLECDRTPAKAASGNYADYTSEAIKSSALAADNSDNLFIGGNYRNPMHIEGTDVVLTPRNVATWNGDPQQSVGDMFIVKFDANGNYVSNLTMTGAADSETILNLTYDGGTLYAEVLVFGTDGAKMTLADKELTLAGAFTPIIAALSSDFSPRWVTVLKGEKISGKYGFQNTGLTVCNNDIWYVGQYDGVISDPTNALNTFTSNPKYPSVREGFLLKLNAKDGSWIKGVSSSESYPRTLGANYSSIVGYFKAIANPEHPEKVYVYGYAMNNNLGIILRSYDAETLASDPATGEWTLVKGGSMPICHSIAYDSKNGRIFIMGRGRNTDFTLLPDMTVKAGNSWAELCAAYQMPNEFISTDSKIVETVVGTTLNIYGIIGGLKIENNAEETAIVEVYDITGRKVATAAALNGETTIVLPAGIYIAAGHKVKVK
ncbi:MAG: T9SS type A sorting domain-containing protein [Clostridium sp.]|nr:T9SS type A sorting domain-containing protein [Prevotella sp.]MCM1429439.1 T9SS type A sorting domain-containing protein [Clostridium sp.]